jgi:hypothetical protein
MGRKRDKLGKSQQEKAATILRRSPRQSPAGPNTTTKSKTSKKQTEDGTEDVVFASVIPFGTTDQSMPVKLSHAGPVGETASAEEAPAGQEGMEGTVTDVAGGMADMAHSNTQLDENFDNDGAKSSQKILTMTVRDTLPSDDGATAAAKAKSSQNVLDSDSDDDLTKSSRRFDYVI